MDLLCAGGGLSGSVSDFSLNNDGFCIQNDGFCIQNDGLWKPDGMVQLAGLNLVAAQVRVRWLSAVYIHAGD